jgi:hypothetical protein
MAVRYAFSVYVNAETNEDFLDALQKSVDHLEELYEKGKSFEGSFEESAGKKAWHFRAVVINQPPGIQAT